MRIETVLEALEYYTGRFPRQALEAAIARREEITPHLLKIVEEAASSIDRLVTDESYMGHIYAFYLLAQFREQRAYPLIVDFFSIPGKLVMDANGYFVTESLGRVLASVSGGDLGPMRSLVEDPQVNEYVRSAALGGMLCLFVEGVTSREELIAYFRQLFRGGLERRRSLIWGSLVIGSMDVCAEELLPDIHQAYALDLVEEIHVDLPWVEKVMAQGREATVAQLRADRHYQFVRDTIGEMEWWACFKPPAPAQALQLQSKKKVGRNDACPCGSGRKYKHCCLRRR